MDNLPRLLIMNLLVIVLLTIAPLPINAQNTNLYDPQGSAINPPMSVVETTSGFNWWWLLPLLLIPASLLLLGTSRESYRQQITYHDIRTEKDDMEEDDEDEEREGNEKKQKA